MTITTPSIPYSTDVWPGRPAPFMRGEAESPWAVGSFGLMPHWAKPTHYRHTYNARAETVASKPTYRQAWKNLQFCAVPAMGFYEPNWETGKAQSHRIERRDKGLFWLAGLWDSFRDNFGQDIYSFTLLTINAELHPLMSRYHGPEDEKRSVVVLPPGVVEDWVHAPSEHAARSLLVPFPAEEFAGSAAR